MSFQVKAGEIVFVGKGNPDPAKFTIIPKDMGITSDTGNFIEQFIFNEFGLTKPKVLLSVTGGAQDFNMLTSKLEQVFNRGLVRAAQNTSAWIITGGLDAGVMRFVGDSIKDQDSMDVPCIGIATKRKVSNHETLVQSEKNFYSQQKPNDDSGCALNPNHTHFILVDSEKNVWGEEISFRTRLEDFISQQWKVPLVLIVVNGGPGTLQTVAEGIERGFPVIIVEGSGRAADAIAARIRFLKNPNYDLDEWNNLIKSQKPENQAKLQGHMENILKGVKQITLFNPNADATSDMDMTILRSILEGSGHSSFSLKLFLGVEWNRPDIIRDLLEKHGDKESSDTKIDALNKALQMSLEQNKPEIFGLLIEKGADKSKVVLAGLYEDEGVKYLLERLIPFVGLSGRKVGGVPDGASEMDSIYPDKSKDKSNFNFRKAGLPTLSMLDIAKKAMSEIGPMYLKVLLDDKVTFTDLLIWAIMVDRIDLAKEIWKQSELPVHSALVACHVYRSLSDWFPGEDEYDDNANWFEEQAIRVLNELDYTVAKTVIDYRWRELDAKNPLQIAEIAECKKFISQQYVQRYLDEVLYSDSHGKLPPGFGVFGVLLLLLFPFWNNSYKPHRPNTKWFYAFTLPISKFVSSTVCYIGFLVLLSYLVIKMGSMWLGTDSRYEILDSEIVLWVWVAAFLFEEVQQFLEDDDYFGRMSNQMDTLIMVQLVIHIALKVTSVFTKIDGIFDASIYVLIVATISAYLRILNVFAFSQSLGPLFFVITRLIKDVVKWVFIFAIFMISFQVGIMALTEQADSNPWQAYPNGTFAVAFFTIIGEYSYAMETMDQTLIGVALLAVYALVAQIMLVNLLIAMMGDTYSDVKDNSVQEWRFYRYVLIYDYKASSAYPPPFNFIFGPLVFIAEKFKVSSAAHYHTLSSETYQQANKSSLFLEESEDKNLIKKLKIAKEKVFEDDEVADSTSMETLSHTIKEHLRIMSNQRDSDRLFLEDHLKDMQEALNEMKAQLAKLTGAGAIASTSTAPK